MNFDVIVLGAGAAGLMCAIEAGKRGRRVLVIEHNDEIGKKILISGGGRCNFTNLNTTPANFISGNPHFAKSALARYTPYDFLELVEKHGIAYHEKADGQLFCDNAARDINDMLQTECDGAGVRILLKCGVLEVKRGWVNTSQGGFEAKSVVVATGGLSIPKIGASPLGYRLAKQFGLNVTPCRPALVPLLLEGFSSLTGVSMEVVATYGEQSFRDKMLFTHRGLSGPALLQISSYWNPGEEISIDLLPAIDAPKEFAGRKQRGERAALKSIIADFLPRRFAEHWAESHDLPPRPIFELPDRELTRIGLELNRWTIAPSGTEGYGKAEVTVGGVDTNGLSSKTMEAKSAPEIYFIGEVVDVTGQLGGYNFQWAWASGWCAGQAV